MKKIIPPNTTSEVQPLDRHFFRMYKHMVRHISHNVDFQSTSDTLQQRDNILKLQSLVFNQFCSPRFERSHQYGWVLADLASRDGEHFQNTSDYCIKHLVGVCNECEKAAIIKCG